MTDARPEPVPDTDGSREGDLRRRIRWDAMAAIIASLVGLLALLVAGYTAWLQRQQVRAEVWPYLILAYQDPSHRLTAFNKGMGPAIVRSVRITVDGRPQADWEQVFASLGLQGIEAEKSTFAGTVLSPGDMLPIQQIGSRQDYVRFRQAMDAHVLMDVCYCSTLGDCWQIEDRHPPRKPDVEAVHACPAAMATGAFRD